MAPGLDYAWSKPRPTELKRLGYTFACRYLSWLPNTKVLTTPERQALHDNGIDIVLNWEFDPGDAKGGYARGVTNAKEVSRQLNVLGAPLTAAVYFSIDFDARSPADLDTVALYLRGISSVLDKKRIGIYGSYYVVEEMWKRGLASYFWQTYAWSSGKWSTHAHIRQVANGVKVDGADSDLDTSMVENFGQWRAPRVEDPDMAWTDYEKNNLLDTIGWPGEQGKRDYRPGPILDGVAAIRDDVSRLRAAALADETRDAAMSAAITALAASINAAGGNVDAAPIIAAVREVHEDARTQFAELTGRIAELESELEQRRHADAARASAEAHALEDKA